MIKPKLVMEILEHHFPEVPIPLHFEDPFTLLIAVLLSAQCTDERVNQVTPALFELAKTPAKMALCTPEAIEAIIRPCGIAKNKSRAIQALSEKLVREFDSQVPKSFEALESLPGVGHKTASVVMAQAFGIPAFPVDTHIHRLAKRWGLSNGKSVEQTEKDLKNHFPKEKWNKLHLQFIYFGRTYCPARGHDEKACPICSRL
ncbi:MAG: Endonuclease III [Chlamydiia bacterium]|nr:Endonuclease III [Chlamydiia bacterium]